MKPQLPQNKILVKKKSKTESLCGGYIHYLDCRNDLLHEYMRENASESFIQS